jgi:hypothetical protein
LAKNARNVPLLKAEHYPTAQQQCQAFDQRLAQIAEEEDWGGEVHVSRDQDETDRALGTGRQEYRLLSVWWD